MENKETYEIVFEKGQENLASQNQAKAEKKGFAWLWAVFALVLYFFVQIGVGVFHSARLYMEFLAERAAQGIQSLPTPVEHMAYVNGKTDFLLSMTFQVQIISIFLFALIYLFCRKRYASFKDTQFSLKAHQAVEISLHTLLVVSFVLGLMLVLSVLASFVPALENFLLAYKAHMGNLMIKDKLLLVFLSVVIGAPLAEELLYRGILLHCVKHHLPTWVAVLVSSALFGLSHMQPMQVIYTFFVGVLMAAIVLRYRSLTAGIVSHMVFNFFGGFVPVVLTVFAGEESVLSAAYPVGVLVLCAGYAFFNKEKIKESLQHYKESVLGLSSKSE